jgi:PPOX class F420-dependent enzyme/OxyR family protein
MGAEDVTGVFSDAELDYLQGRRLGRLATLGEDGYPHVVPVAFRYDPEAGAIDVGGHRPAEPERLQDVRRGVAALLVDDLPTQGRPRAVEVCGDAVTLDTGGKAMGGHVDEAIIRISPRRIVSWGLEAEPQAERSVMGRLTDFFADLRVGFVFLAALLAWVVSFFLTTRVFRSWDTSGLAVALTAWACAGTVFVLLTLWRFLPMAPEQLRDRLETREKETALTGHVMRLWTTVIFVAAIVFTVVGLQSGQRDHYTTVAAILAVMASWFAIHALHAEYYAHEYYRRRDGSAFFFPGDEGRRRAHGYLDFAYFSLAIASTFGTTDVKIHGDVVRRSVLLHEVISVWFNLGIVAAVVALALG